MFMSEEFLLSYAFILSLIYVNHQYILYIPFHIRVEEPIMPQFHFYVPESVAKRIKEGAQTAGVSTSRYISKLVKNQIIADWPEEFFSHVAGGWQGEELQRGSQGELEVRDSLDQD